MSDTDHHRRVALRQLLANDLDLSELRALSFDLGIHPDDLAGQKRGDVALELLTTLDRQGRIDELVRVGSRLYPKIDWENASSGEPPLDTQPITELPDLFPPALALIGQQAHLDALGALYDHAAAERCGRIVFLAARPGFGRRALAQTICEYAHEREGTALLLRFWPDARLSEAQREALWDDDPLLDPAAAALEPTFAGSAL